ncbi:DUF177 domain-containing protein [Patescibacteria group bacterium]|nr:DUF177 domain-containing protein [Patescibacteria group bacterium]
MSDNPHLYINVREVAVGTTDEKTVSLSINPEDIEKATLTRPLTGTITLFKDDDGVYAEFDITAHVEEICERCLTPKTFKRELSFERLYTGEPDKKNFAEHELPGTFQIDIFDDIKNELLLTTPLKIVCEEECKGLCEKCGENLNKHPNHKCKIK